MVSVDGEDHVLVSQSAMSSVTSPGLEITVSCTHRVQCEMQSIAETLSSEINRTYLLLVEVHQRLGQLQRDVIEVTLGEVALDEPSKHTSAAQRVASCRCGPMHIGGGVVSCTCVT